MQELIRKVTVVVFVRQVLKVEVDEPIGAPGETRLCFPEAKKSVLLHLLPSISNTSWTGMLLFLSYAQGLLDSTWTAVRVIRDSETIQWRLLSCWACTSRSRRLLTARICMPASLFSSCNFVMKHCCYFVGTSFSQVISCPCRACLVSITILRAYRACLPWSFFVRVRLAGMINFIKATVSFVLRMRPIE